MQNLKTGSRSQPRQSDAAGCSLKKLGWPVDRRGVTIYLLQQYSVGERRMCSVLKIYRNVYRYQSVKDQQARLRM
jgi:hypothetical protein